MTFTQHHHNAIEYQKFLQIVHDHGPIVVDKNDRPSGKYRKTLVRYGLDATATSRRVSGFVNKAERDGALVVVRMRPSEVRNPDRQESRFVIGLYTPEQAAARNVINHTVENPRGTRFFNRPGFDAPVSHNPPASAPSVQATSSFLTIEMYGALLNQADAADARVAELEAQIVLLTEERDAALAALQPKPDPIQQGILHRLRQRGIE